MLGYTQEELADFRDYYPAVKSKYSEIYTDIDKAIKEWYNGYSWNGTDYVYNPFSILSFFKNRQFENYWFATGTPTFLMKLIRERNYNIPELANIEILRLALDKFNIDKPEIIPLLFQTGYLTIKKSLLNEILHLGFPNKEVDNAFNIHLLAELNEAGIDNTSIVLLKMARLLKEGKPDDFINLLIGIFSGIAYENIEPKENYFHSLFYLVVKLLGYIIESEIQTSDGRIDAVVWTDNFRYIIEFKMGKAKEAMQQISEKLYHLKYTTDIKKIFLLGIGFDAVKKQVNDWIIEEI
ncbi:MAG: ATP-binding protein, partial [Bacteroidetes bacterium]|nr:ATP-binding protein [Bacteroidota bacterium]